MDAFEHEIPCQSVAHLALAWVSPDLPSVYICWVVLPEGLDLVLFHHLAADALHQLESIPVHLERIVTFVLVPLLLDLSSHSRVARQARLGLGAGAASSPLMSLE